MTGKKILTMALGGLLALNVVNMTVPATATTAEAAEHLERDIDHNDEFNRAIRPEHDRHVRKMDEIREKYHSHKHKMQQEMQGERERHEKKMREINQQYHHYPDKHRPSAHSTHHH